MGKRLFLLLFSAIMGIICNPEILMASDSFNLTGLNNTSITETIPIAEEAMPTEDTERNASVAISANAYAASQPTYVAPIIQMTNYTISFYINSREEYVETYKNLSYNGIYKFRKMIYGHNTDNLLGSLVNRYVGETFSITEGGAERNYQVADIQVYRKTEDGNLENNKKLMSNIANTAMGYDVALFTCYGTSYGNGDASHRLVVFANAI